MAWPGWENFDPRAHNAQQRVEKKRKYRNEPTDIDGYIFASKREANRYLHLREQAGNRKISELEIQPRFPLHVVRDDKVKIEVGCYVADFRYIRDGVIVVEDAKGLKTALYSWKKRHVEAEYSITIVEV